MLAFVIFRDRLEYGRRTAEAFDSAGLDTVLVDHGTTYEPALEWLGTRDDVIYRGPGHHPRSIWDWDKFRSIRASERFIVSDPDTPPSADCPDDWAEHLNAVMDETGQSRVGMGLRIDNLPDYYQRKQQVIDWESQYWTAKASGSSWSSPVDTTLSLNAPTAFFSICGVRTDFPYVADHLPWYEDYDNLAPDVQYYHEHAENGISEWTIPGKSARFG